MIEKTRAFLEQKEKLDLVQIRQLEGIISSAANNPETVSDIVSKRIAAENSQNEMPFGFDFNIDGNSTNTGNIEGVLGESDDLSVRLKNWEESKEVGIELKGGLENLVTLRNQTVQALGYDDYFSYQVSEYGMTRVVLL